MVRQALLGGCVMIAALVGCGDDDGGGGGGDAGGGGNGDLLLNGTSCEGAVTYRLGGDEKMSIYTDSATGAAEAILLFDGPVFDSESDAAWQTYAATYDTALLLGFRNLEQLAPHTITDIFDSYFGGRGVGVLGFSEDNDASIRIVAIDTVAKTIEVTFTIPVHASTTGYPPDFAALVECTTGSVIGSFSGPYDLKSF